MHRVRDVKAADACVLGFGGDEDHGRLFGCDGPPSTAVHLRRRESVIRLYLV